MEAIAAGKNPNLTCIVTIESGNNIAARPLTSESGRRDVSSHLSVGGVLGGEIEEDILRIFALALGGLNEAAKLAVF